MLWAPPPGVNPAGSCADDAMACFLSFLIDLLMMKDRNQMTLILITITPKHWQTKNRTTVLGYFLSYSFLQQWQARQTGKDPASNYISIRWRLSRLPRGAIHATSSTSTILKTTSYYSADLSSSHQKLIFHLKLAIMEAMNQLPNLVILVASLFVILLAHNYYSLQRDFAQLFLFKVK